MLWHGRNGSLPKQCRYLWTTSVLPMLQGVGEPNMHAPKVMIATSLALFLIASSGCRRSSSQKPVVVNILRDQKSQAFEITESKLLEFQSTRPKTQSGRQIIVQSILMNQDQFEAALANQLGLSKMQPDLIVLDSPAQSKPWMQVAEIEARNACYPAIDCPAFIPPWVSGEQKAATASVLRALSGGS